MKPNIYLMLYAILTAQLLTSCDQLLETDIPANQLSANLVFESPQTADAALAGLYAGLYDQSPLSGDASGALLSYYTDDLLYLSQSNPTFSAFYTNQLLPGNTMIENYWNQAYQKIYYANAIIEGTSLSPALGEAQKKRLTGEALVARAILYTYLVQVFGDIPYPTATDYRVNQNLPKMTTQQIYQQITQDLNRAHDLLEDTYRHAERIYPNKTVALFLLARVQMLRKQWGAAETSLTTVINNPLYVFQENISKVFDKSGQHILWQLKPLNNNDPTKEAQVYYFTGIPTVNALNPDLINSFSSEDVRKQEWTTAVSTTGITWYRANKYKNRTNNLNEYSIVIRLEEAYLMMAEVLAHQDRLAEALPYVNRIRQRAGLAAITSVTDKEHLLTIIKDEFRKEFFTEGGQRFFVLKRMDLLETLLPVKPHWKSYHRLWPIPQRELLQNANLLPQNDGY